MKSRPNIMVVDDEVGICKNVEKILKKSNYKVTHAVSAKDAIEKMKKASFSLMISDIVMPEMNGLELLKTVKKQWPHTKAVMMTAYASTDTAVKAIRTGALDYIPKPFTPDELRSTVEKALEGKLIEARISETEKEAINIIDVDIPFDVTEVEKVTGKDYADTIGPSDMPVITAKGPQALEGFCETGSMVCDIFKKLSGTCKAGVKTAKCPQLAKKKKAAKAKGFDSKKLIGIDQPFDYNEVASVTGPEYIQNLHSDGVSAPYYAQLKENAARMIKENAALAETTKKVAKGVSGPDAALSASRSIDVDIPFDMDEVAKVTGKEYAETIGPSDMPVVESIAPEMLEGFCETGDMVCDIFKKLGATCKAGIKKEVCPQLAKKKKAAKKKVMDTAALIAPDMPFDYQEVEAATGKDYIDNLVYDGIAQVPYAQLKRNVEKIQEAEKRLSDDVYRFPKEAVGNNILVIDDEVAVNNNIRKILAKKGFHVDQAVTKAEAVERIDKRAYRLVLLDLKIPGVKGLELLEKIKNRSPETMVIMITGYASIETAVEAARMGAMDYIPKPFTPDELRNATENAFRQAA